MQIIFGDDKVKIQSYISNSKNKFDKSLIYEFQGLSKSELDVKDLLSSNALFDDRDKLVIVKVEQADKSRIVDFIKQTEVLVNKTTLLFVLSYKLDAATTKILPKEVEIIKFEEKFDSQSFDICDCLFIRNDKKSAISKLLNIREDDATVFMFGSLAQTYVRNILSIKLKNESSTKISPFFKSKLQNSKLEISSLKKILEDIYKLEFDMKSNSYKSKLQVLQDFMIYSF